MWCYEGTSEERRLHYCLFVSFEERREKFVDAEFLILSRDNLRSRVVIAGTEDGIL